jgi:hypothetical protein
VKAAHRLRLRLLKLQASQLEHHIRKGPPDALVLRARRAAVIEQARIQRDVARVDDAQVAYRGRK